MHVHLLYLLEETPLKVTQDGKNRNTNKMVDRVKYLWVLATPLDVDVGVG